MIEARPSRTAFRVATRRAAHQLIDRPLVFDDPFALRIIGPTHAEALRARSASRFKTRASAPLRAFLAVRSRVAEDALADAVAAGVRQYVVLGAGLDTFSLRNPFAGEGLKVFEVDHPATQEWKRGLLDRLRLRLLPSATLVPVDFERQSAEAELTRHGFDPATPTFFSWLGVTMYLHAPTVMSTLGWIASMGHRGGGVVFDYALAQPELTLPDRLRYWFLARRVRRAGEPWLSGFVPDRLQADLRRLGFAAVEDLSPDTLNRRYFSDRTDGLKVGRLAHLMRAGT